MKVLALDYGSKRVGVATGDSDLGIAFAKAVIPNLGKEALLVSVRDLMTEHGCKMVVVGLPLNSEGDENPILDDVKDFVDLLKNDGVEVELFDETLSSFEARELMDDVKMKHGNNDLKLDAYAALIILQRFFEKSF